MGPGVAAACDVTAVVVGTRRSRGRGRGRESTYICHEYGHLRIEGSDIRMRLEQVKLVDELVVRDGLLAVKHVAGDDG